MKWEIKLVGPKGEVAAKLQASEWPGHVTDEAGKAAFDYAKGVVTALLVGFPAKTTHARINVQGVDGEITQMLAVSVVEAPPPPAECVCPPGTHHADGSVSEGEHLPGPGPEEA